MLENKKILIVGLGLLGGSFASALRGQGCEVGAITRRQSSIDYALQKGIISHGMAEVNPEYVGQFDLLIFALYPHVFVEWIEKYQGYIKPGAIITDVTGVKSCIVPKIKAMLRPDLEFVPAHPMAGREVYGVENSDPSIFEGANFIITPGPDNTPKAVALVQELSSKLGFRKCSTLSPEEHDEMIGFLSQLPHCIAVALMASKDSKHLVDYTGDSFRDFTRIANINGEMWSELFIDNKAELLQGMDLFLGEFLKLRQAIESSDVDKMKEMMALSSLRRSYFGNKKR